MSNELVPQDIGGPLANADEFKDVVSSGDYLSRFQLFGAKTDAVAEQKIAMGHYGVVKDDEITDLGEEVDAVIITWRSKAVQTGDDFLICHDVKNELFQKIKALSSVQDSGCMYGPEFLLWIPDPGIFTAYHMNSKTARREAKKMGPLIGKAATLKCRLIDPPTSKYKWHGPVVLPCSVPLSVPDEATLREVATKFRNPETPEPEAAPEDDRPQ